MVSYREWLAFRDHLFYHDLIAGDPFGNPKRRCPIWAEFYLPTYYPVEPKFLSILEWRTPPPCTPPLRQHSPSVICLPLQPTPAEDPRQSTYVDICSASQLRFRIDNCEKQSQVTGIGTIAEAGPKTYAIQSLAYVCHRSGCGYAVETVGVLNL
eukprot:4368275-Pyramimonas_sp.AAC.4